MKTIKGPGVFLAPFVADEPPFNSIDGLAGWAAAKGFKGVQIPTWDKRVIDLRQAAESQTYCDDYAGKLAERGLVLTDLATHLQGQLVAAHPAYDLPDDSLAVPEVRGNLTARQAWAVEQLRFAALASRRFGVKQHVTFSGALLWPYLYPYPQYPDGLIEDGFNELARRWRPILDFFDEQGVDLCYEIHPAEDLHDGLTFEMFLERVHNHRRCNIMYDPSHFVLQALDYLAYIDHYHERIKMFHVSRGARSPGAEAKGSEPARHFRRPRRPEILHPCQTTQNADIQPLGETRMRETAQTYITCAAVSARCLMSAVGVSAHAEGVLNGQAIRFLVVGDPVFKSMQLMHAQLNGRGLHRRPGQQRTWT
jgi:sugar phosphate isomerase/epimerase